MSSLLSTAESITQASTALRNVISALRRNPQFAHSIRKAISPQTRTEGLGELLDQIYEKLIRTMSSPASNSAVGFARRLLEDRSIAESLSGVDHLGVVPVHGRRFPATRLAYVHLTIDETAKLRKACPALGLGSNTKLNNSYEPGKRLSRLELTQTWAIIANLGHLFGTFATERAVLFLLQDNAKLEKAFFEEIQDDEVRQIARSHYDKKALHRFFYVLAGWRLFRNFPDKARATAIDVYKTVGGDRDQVCKWTYRHARQIAYNRIHGVFQARGLGQLFQIDSLYENIGQAQEIASTAAIERSVPLFSLINEYDKYLQETFFSSVDVGAQVLAHIREFKEWWSSGNEKGTNRLLKLFSKPLDWPPQRPGDPLKHYLRLKLSGGDGQWIDTVRNWLGDHSHWQSWNFLVTSSPSHEQSFVDIYRSKKFEHSAARKTFYELGRYDISDEHLDEACARATLKVLSEVLSPRFIAVLRPLPTLSESRMAIVRHNSVDLVNALKNAKLKLANPRRDEVSACIDCLSKNAISEPCSFILCKLVIIDKETSKEELEIDGLWISFYESKIELNLLEQKTGSPGGESARARMKAVLRQELTLSESQDAGSVGRFFRLTASF